MGVQLSCAPKADLKGQRELARRRRKAAKAKAHAVGGARVSASIEKHRDDLDVAQRTRAVQRRPAVLRAMAAWSDARGGWPPAGAARRCGRERTLSVCNLSFGSVHFLNSNRCTASLSPAAATAAWRCQAPGHTEAVLQGSQTNRCNHTCQWVTSRAAFSAREAGRTARHRHHERVARAVRQGARARHGGAAAKVRRHGRTPTVATLSRCKCSARDFL